MSGEQNAPETIFDLVADMEASINRVDVWAKAFQAVAAPENRIDPEVIDVMADALEELGDRLKFKFRRAFEMARDLEEGRKGNP
ncbi:hypothetical protein [Methylobacterium sp. J-090]|uniref:hypothetical protein n=1 Tax=Methylobacterium sp. J-090 TaxID=2836666 RepID=UPI001FBC0645|nr:hypothetical protein [Methylobacterium sp. J-090]MCJ2084339.1 hypothetical protein [Methylobacterium sp. J-090]